MVQDRASLEGDSIILAEEFNRSKESAQHTSQKALSLTAFSVKSAFEDENPSKPWGCGVAWLAFLAWVSEGIQMTPVRTNAEDALRKSGQPHS